MGYVRVNCLIGDPEQTKLKEVAFLVDTVSFYPVVPPILANEIGLKRVMTRELVLANNQRVKGDLAVAYFKVLDRDGGFLVIIMDCPEPLLGVTVLEGLGVKVDPATGEVAHSRPYGVAILRT